jgi:hypothetical protein
MTRSIPIIQGHLDPAGGIVEAAAPKRVNAWLEEMWTLGGKSV